MNCSTRHFPNSTLPTRDQRRNHRRVAIRMCSPLVAVLLAITLGSCSGSTLTPEEKEYQERAMNHPTVFTLLKSEERQVWERAVSWIRTYSNMPLAELTPTVIKTDAAGEGRDFELSFGYEVTKKDVGEDRIEVLVKCATNHMFYGEQADENAHLLAYYIATGEVPSPRVVNQ
jgi:hypothetical protein